eukprot:jgi/Chlat1/882/Chrsp107S01345
MVEEDGPMSRHIRMLENRLDKALVKFNEAQAIRRTYGQIVKRLHHERVGFDNQLAAIERTLKAKEHDLHELILMSHDANHAKEIAKAELMKVTNALVTERSQREKDIADRRNSVKLRQDVHTRNMQREKTRHNMQLEAMGDLPEEAESAMKQAVVANTLIAENNDRAVEEEQKRITTFEEALRKIKDATGVSDIGEVSHKHDIPTYPHTHVPHIPTCVSPCQVIAKFTTQEDTLQSLKQMTVEEVKYSGGGLGGRRAVDEVEAHLLESTAHCDRSRTKYERAARTFVRAKAGIIHLADKLTFIKIDQVHAYTCLCVRVWLRARTCAGEGVSICVCLRVCVCMRVCSWKHTRLCKCMCVRSCARASVCMCQ